MIVEVVAEGYNNEQELHRHASITGHRDDVESVLGVSNSLTLTNIDLSAQKTGKDDPLHGHQEDLDADQVSIEEWVILARNRLLELDEHEYLVDNEDSGGELHREQWEINKVAMIKDVL